MLSVAEKILSLGWVQVKTTLKFNDIIQQMALSAFSGVINTLLTDTEAC